MDFLQLFDFLLEFSFLLFLVKELELFLFKLLVHMAILVVCDGGVDYFFIPVLNCDLHF